LDNQRGVKSLPKNATIIAGPNGVGKTTFAKRYLDIRRSFYVSADEIALKLNLDDVQKVRVQAGKLFFQNIKTAVDSGQNLLIEVTLAGRSFQRIVDLLKQAHYTVYIIFIFLESPELCVDHIHERVTSGGHDVPKEDIIRRFYRSITNFWQIYKNMADMWSIYSNSSNRFYEVAAGAKDQVNIYDNELFKLFLNNVGEINDER
jgi:predicted ABC-type ATPase